MGKVLVVLGGSDIGRADAPAQRSEDDALMLRAHERRRKKLTDYLSRRFFCLQSQHLGVKIPALTCCLIVLLRLVFLGGV